MVFCVEWELLGVGVVLCLLYLGFFCEYDVLFGIGYVCGYNLIVEVGVVVVLGVKGVLEGFCGLFLLVKVRWGLGVGFGFLFSWY